MEELFSGGVVEVCHNVSERRMFMSFSFSLKLVFATKNYLRKRRENSQQYKFGDYY